MKPRHLYLSLFTYYALSGGRFTAPFLEHQLNLHENWMIGSALALQILIGSICSPYFGILADRWDANSKVCHGRLLIMFVGLTLSTVAMLLHTVVFFAPTSNIIEDAESISTGILVYHLLLRCIFSMGVAATSPVLNGLTLARLERDGMHANDFGKERLYGAISWGVSNSIFGVAIDTWGFGIVYLTTVLSFITCSLVFYLYARADDATIMEDLVIDDRKHHANKFDGRYTNNDTISVDEGKELATFKTDSSGDFEEEKKFADEEFNEASDNNIHSSDCLEDNQSSEQFSFSFLIKTLCNQPTPLLNISYIVALFTLYIGMSVVENLIFLYFEFLGGSNTLCGLTVAVTVLFELPLFHFAPDILRWMKSPVWMFQWGCLAYVVRVIGYSIIPESHASWVLILEPLHGVTIGFVLTGSVAFVDSLMPKGYESSGQGFLSSVMGLGQFVGLCIGGILEGRVLYRVLAGIVSFGSFVLAFGHRLSARSTTKDMTPSSLQMQPVKGQVKVIKRKCSDVVVPLERKSYVKVTDIS
jgi:Na+/melibiose symporter-like transporter